MESRTGAAHLLIPLGPGIGSPALGYQPLLVGRFAPTAIPRPGRGNPGTRFATGAFELSPGHLELEMPSTPPVARWTFPDGVQGCTGGSLPPGTDPDQVLARFGYTAGAGGLPRHEGEPSPGAFLLPGGGGELLLGLAPEARFPSIPPPVSEGQEPPEAWVVPSHLLAVRGDLAYEFQFSGTGILESGPPSTAQYRLTAVRSPSGKHVTFTYGPDGVDFEATGADTKLRVFLDGAAPVPPVDALDDGESAGDPDAAPPAFRTRVVRLRLTYEDAWTRRSYTVTALAPNGPPTGAFRRNLQVNRVRADDTGEYLRFTYGKAVTDAGPGPTVLQEVGYPGRSIRLEWEGQGGSRVDDPWSFGIKAVEDQILGSPDGDQVTRHALALQDPALQPDSPPSAFRSSNPGHILDAPKEDEPLGGARESHLFLRDAEGLILVLAPPRPAPLVHDPEVPPKGGLKGGSGHPSTGAGPAGTGGGPLAPIPGIPGQPPAGPPAPAVPAPAPPPTPAMPPAPQAPQPTGPAATMEPPRYDPAKKEVTLEAVAGRPEAVPPGAGGARVPAPPGSHGADGMAQQVAQNQQRIDESANRAREGAAKLNEDVKAQTTALQAAQEAQKKETFARMDAQAKHHLEETQEAFKQDAAARLEAAQKAAGEKAAADKASADKAAAEKAAADKAAADKAAADKAAADKAAADKAAADKAAADKAAAEKAAADKAAADKAAADKAAADKAAAEKAAADKAAADKAAADKAAADKAAADKAAADKAAADKAAAEKAAADKAVSDKAAADKAAADKAAADKAAADKAAADKSAADKAAADKAAADKAAADKAAAKKAAADKAAADKAAADKAAADKAAADRAAAGKASGDKAVAETAATPSLNEEGNPGQSESKAELDPNQAGASGVGPLIRIVPPGDEEKFDANDYSPRTASRFAQFFADRKAAGDASKEPGVEVPGQTYIRLPNGELKPVAQVAGLGGPFQGPADSLAAFWQGHVTDPLERLNNRRLGLGWVEDRYVADTLARIAETDPARAQKIMEKINQERVIAGIPLFSCVPLGGAGAKKPSFTFEFPGGPPSAPAVATGGAGVLPRAGSAGIPLPSGVATMGGSGGGRGPESKQTRPDDSAPMASEPQPRGQYQPPPRGNLEGAINAARIKNKSGRARWRDDHGNIFEWDSQHGRLEKYNKAGKHQGEFDPASGTQTKPADPSRRIEK